MSPLTESAPLRLAQGYTRPDDPDAVAYIAAVEAADGQALEAATRMAINAFVKGCKADGTWPALKASCILAGARTLAGALVPLVGAAPTNVNFVSGDYNRKTGLVGDGATKSLNTNRAANADPQNSRHMAVYLSTAGGANQIHIGDAGYASNGNSEIYRGGIGGDRFGGRSVHAANLALSDLGITAVTVSGSVPCLFGMVRTGAAAQALRGGGQTTSNTTASVAPATATVRVFTNAASEARTTARLAFYSIGESLDLTLLDARVTALVNAFAAAIP